MKIHLFLILVLTFSFSAFGQTAQSALKGLNGKTRVYVAAQTTASEDEIKQYLSQDIFKIAEGLGDAQFILELKMSGLTAFYFDENKRKVIAWSKSKDSDNKLQPSDVKLLTGQFVKDYKISANIWDAADVVVCFVRQ